MIVANNKEYVEKFKNPLWQKKRLLILERAKFKCENCGSEKSTLHVHHGYYEWNRDPWDYPNESLHCLCEKCHNSAQGLLKQVRSLIGYLSTDGLLMVHGYLTGRLALENIVQLECRIPSSFYARAVADGADVDWEELLKKCSDDKWVLELNAFVQKHHRIYIDLRKQKSQ